MRKCPCASIHTATFINTRKTLKFMKWWEKQKQVKIKLIISHYIYNNSMKDQINLKAKMSEGDINYTM